jgi:hypothetical protein
LRDVVIGMNDGRTVPFALAAGLSGAVDQSSIIVIAGIARSLQAVLPWAGRLSRRETEQDH